ncbi:helix-turn-helix domain-containing protein [Lachnospiraceae bacterium LCP25S3_G4]
MYKIFENLLEKFNVTTYQVAKATGISTASFTGWKQGKWNFKSDKLQKIADYFNVSLEYLMTGEEKEGGETYYLNDDTREIAQEIFENKELRLLFDASRDAQPEDLKVVHDMLLALKRKERGETD